MTLHDAIGYEQRIDVTDENLDDLREGQLTTNDQRAELEAGCMTWGIIYADNGQRGDMTVWPNGRVALCDGGNSIWGDWDDRRSLMTADDGTVYDVAGSVYEEPNTD